MTVNLIFYVYLFWIGIALYRAARGTERLIVIGWFVPIFLGPIQYLFSISLSVIGFLNFVAVFSAFLASAYILFKVSAVGPPQLDNQNS